jgi:pimeloyl-ACP methyl ester carboxylesterase
MANDTRIGRCIRGVARLCVILAAFGAAAAQAADGVMLRVPTRDGVTVPVFWVAQDDAAATLVLLPGGTGAIGQVPDGGWPDGTNFLIRSGRLFAAHRFNLAMVSRPSDVQDLDYAFRNSDAHLDDLRAVLAFARARSAAPLWLVGTSRGSISAAAAAVAARDDRVIAGVVLTSSITHYAKAGALPYQQLERIDVPVLLVHHRRDACRWCEPRAMADQLARLTAAPVRKLAMVDGGTGATGDPCEPMHWHGFVGMEGAVVDLISAWIKQPAP